MTKVIIKFQIPIQIKTYPSLLKLVLASFLFPLFGQVVSAQSFVTLTDSSNELRIGKSVYYIKETKKPLDFQKILLGNHDKDFIQFDQESPNFGNVELTTWNKFSIVNNSSKEWVLLVDSYSLDSLHFYYPDTNKKYQKIRSGRSIPFSKRQYKTSIYTFDIDVPKGDTAVFYLRVSSFFMQYPMIIASKEKFIATYHTKDILEGFYFGFIFLIIVYNFLLFLSVRDKSYLYYICYVIANALLIALLKGFIAELWGDSFHFLWSYSPAIIAAISVVGFLFIQNVLETKRYTPFLNKIMNYLFKPSFFIIILFSLFNNNLIASLLNQILGIVGMLVCYITAIKVYKQGFIYARFYIAACWIYFLGIIIFVLKAFNILPYNFFTNNAIEIGSTLQLIMFAFTISDKVNTYKKEKAKAQEELVHSLRANEELITEQNKVLEEKVEMRTSELQLTLSALEVSQIELKQKNELITFEKERSDSLLLNILPYETAQELKETGSAEAKLFDNVTVIFTDFKDFSTISEFMKPAELVAELHTCFTAFDSIADKYDIEKIKTIGDSYMAVSGLPVADKLSMAKAIYAALDIEVFMREYNTERIQKGLQPFEIRIGIHTGDVVAGIVGSKKFAYDIWGDTVNTASRMESSGEAGKVNISGTTYDLVKDIFHCTYRGKVAAKNKGEIDMYFVDGVK